MIIEEEGGVQEIATTKESTQVPIYSFYGTAEDQMREIMKSYYGKRLRDEENKLKMYHRKSFPIRVVGTMVKIWQWYDLVLAYDE